jgi:hypothetical protein
VLFESSLHRQPRRQVPRSTQRDNLFDRRDRPIGETRRLRAGNAVLAASAATGITTALTLANRLGDLPLSSLAASAQTIENGKLWLIVTSGLIADRPAVPSLIGFWIVGLAVLLVCSTRLAVGVAVAGHTLSALGIYGVIGLTRLVDPHAFSTVAKLADYGLSAMIAAWLGAIARTFWARYPSHPHRLLIALGSLGCAGVGLAFRPDVTFLDSEHLLAYTIGVILADQHSRRRLTKAARRLATATASLELLR